MKSLLIQLRCGNVSSVDCRGILVWKSYYYIALQIINRTWDMRGGNNSFDSQTHRRLWFPYKPFDQRALIHSNYQLQKRLYSKIGSILGQKICLKLYWLPIFSISNPKEATLICTLPKVFIKDSPLSSKVLATKWIALYFYGFIVPTLSMCCILILFQKVQYILIQMKRP